MSMTEKAKEILISGGYTCVILKEDRQYTSDKRGVRPLLDLLDSGADTKDAVAADKVVGAGAAHLYVLLGVKAVWAAVVSTPAKKVMEENGIEVLFDKEVSFIINRTGDGVCPIENCVKGAKDSSQALLNIRDFLG